MINLISVSLPNGDFIEYLIDAQNRRIGKKLNGVLEKQWIYQDQLNPVAELDGNGNLISRFVYGDKGHVPAYIVKGDSTYRFITDHLGSVRLVINVASGHVAQYITYDNLVTFFVAAAETRLRRVQILIFNLLVMRVGCLIHIPIW